MRGFRFEGVARQRARRRRRTASGAAIGPRGPKRRSVPGTSSLILSRFPGRLARGAEYRIFVRYLSSADASVACAPRHAPRLRRAALPLQLQLPARRLAPGGAGRSARRRSATRRSRSPTNARSPAWCARTSRRRTAACSSSSAAKFALADGLKLVLLATDRDGYGNLSRAHHARPAPRRRRAAIALDARRPRRRRCRGCLALLDAAGRRPATATTRRSQRALARRALSRAAPGSPSSCCARAGRPRAPRALRGARASEPACRWSPPATCTCTCARARALQDMLTAIRLQHAGRASAATRCIPTPSGTCARARGSRASIRRELLAETAARSPSAARFSLDELRYEYPEELVPPGATPASPSARSSPRRACAALSRTGVPDEVRALIEHELALIAELRYEPYFLTVHDIVALRAQRRASSARAAARRPTRRSATASASPRSIPARMTHAVRALHLAASATSRPTSTSTSSTSGARR